MTLPIDGELDDIVRRACRAAVLGNVRSVSVVWPRPLQAEEIGRIRLLGAGRGVAVFADESGVITMRSRPRPSRDRRWISAFRRLGHRLRLVAAPGGVGASRQRP